MRSIPLLLLVALGAGCDDDEPEGTVVISRVDRMMVPFTSAGACWVSPLLDEDPDAAGLQPACSGTFLLSDGSDGLLPMCDGSINVACWRLVDDAQCAVTGLALAVNTQGLAFQPGATAIVECVLAD